MRLVPKAGFWNPVGNFLRRQLGFDFEMPPAARQRPQRRHTPVITATPAGPRQHAPGVARPPRGTLDLEFWRLLKARRDAGDPQQRRVYQWEREVLAAMPPEPLLGGGGKRRVDRPQALAGSVASEQ